MLVSWYLPTVDLFSLWPCAALLIVFVPVSIWHERNWRRTLAAYAQVRRDAGAADEDWPSPELARVMGVQPALVLSACAALAAVVGLAAWAVLLWPRRPFGFDMPINPFDLPYLWSMLVAGVAAIVAGVAIAVDARSNPWYAVTRIVRPAMHAPADERARRFAQALRVDPGVPHGGDTASGGASR